MKHTLTACALLLTLSTNAQTKLETELVSKYGEAQRPRIVRGIRQVADFWRPADGDQAVMEDFIRTNFAGDQTTLDALFDRMQFIYESLFGYTVAMGRDLKRQTDLDRGPVYPFDEALAEYSPAAHINDDLFANKIAFTILLNFRLTTLDERLAEGEKWSRREWAETKMAEAFSKRIPAEVNLEFSRLNSETEQYVSNYNIWMHHLVDAKGARLFPPKMRLLEHWNLRDEIKASYSDPKDGLAKQRTIMRVMERIVDQSIPNQVVDNPAFDWNPWTNEVKPAAVTDAAKDFKPGAKIDQPDSRYATIQKNFRGETLIDKYSPTAPTLIRRKFEEERQIPQARVRAMFESVLTSPLVPRVAKLIEARLGRKLEPFDIWYNGFRPRGQYTDAQLDEITKKKYPTPEAYKADMPRLFHDLGFSPETAAMLAANIVVDPARGSGHALGAGRRDDHPHLRTRVGAEGMDYKGYNIAVHEMGHNVEQTFSLNSIDYYTLSGVPNTAFTEALAFVFQNHDLELLGLAKPTAESSALKTLNDFWGTYEIAGVALVDMAMWEWMYAHPNATPAELRAATVQISKDLWNRYYAPVFKVKDVTLLGIYAHMVDRSMYLPDYPIGHLIAFQIDEQMEKAKNIGGEFERMAKMGAVTPDLWMKNATGAPVGSEALLRATEKALGTVK